MRGGFPPFPQAAGYALKSLRLWKAWKAAYDAASAADLKPGRACRAQVVRASPGRLPTLRCGRPAPRSARCLPRVGLAPPCPGATAPYGSPSAGCPALAPCPPRARSMARMTSPSPRAPDCAHDQPPFCRLMQDVRMYSQTGLRPVCEYIRSWQGCALHPPPGLPRAFRHVASGAARAGLPRRFATWLPALRLATHALVG